MKTASNRNDQHDKETVSTMTRAFFFPIYEHLERKGLLSDKGTPWDWFVVLVAIPLYLTSPLFAAAWLLPRP